MNGPVKVGGEMPECELKERCLRVACHSSRISGRAKGRATDTPQLVWHREVPFPKARGVASKFASSARLRIATR